MRLRCFFSMPSGVKRMAHRCVSMVSRLLVMSGLVMLGRFSVVSRDMRGVFRCLFVVLRSFLRHGISSPVSLKPNPLTQRAEVVVVPSCGATM
jgi:hypothetical protein